MDKDLTIRRAIEHMSASACTLFPAPRKERWHIHPHFDESGEKVKDFLRVMVMTPRGTGPTAAGITLIPVQYVNNRQVLASYIRAARLEASEFRKANLSKDFPPDWPGILPT